MKRRPTALRSIIKGSSHLQQLLQQAGDVSSLTARVRDLLPAGLAAHLSNAVGRGRMLVLFTDSPVWATRLRYTTPGLRASLGGFDDVQVKIAPAGSAAAGRKDDGMRKPHLGREAARQIRAMADTLSDPDLKRALRRLADHGAD